MKKYSVLFLFAAVVLQYSCNKSLDPKVYSTLTNTNAFQTESDAMAAVNAVYGRLKGPLWEIISHTGQSGTLH